MSKFGHFFGKGDIYLPHTFCFFVFFQVESRYILESSKPLNDLSSIFDTESSERMQKILDSNVGQIQKVN